MNNKDVLKKVIALFSTMSETEDITKESELIDDLGISSMDILFLVSRLEAEFKVSVPEKEVRKLVTVGDVADMVIRLTK